MTATFLLEFLARIFALGGRFWTSQDWKFNVLDLVLVLVSVVDIAVQGFNLSFARVLRLLKIFTTLRTLRHLRATVKLRAMMLAILHSLGSLTWATILLGIMTFLFACVLVQGSTDYVQHAPLSDASVEFIQHRLNSLPMTVLTLWMCVTGGVIGGQAVTNNLQGTSDDFTVAQLRTFFENVPLTMLTLFMSITGGVSWWEVERVLLDMSFLMGMLLVVYVCLMLLALLNIVTGIFLHDSIETAQLESDLSAQLEMQKINKLVSKLQEVFMELDTNNSETLDLDEFRRYLTNERVVRLFQELGLDARDPITLFSALDLDGTRDLDISEFVMGCMALRGGARAVDLATFMNENRIMIKRLRTGTTDVQDRLDRIERALSVLPDSSTSLRHEMSVVRNASTFDI
eukprot:CAMPEP_0194553016 /NCGR_PEP_ID=MMETSP0253-20130528/97018_1 /TAXON_ID=2966 /ORGANISM="Noctiluca scintillans" /LENGTH=401 /DNA_ID=CAMNT_0039400491 /DNA_START=8 /DNA_END=1214 /DNA_ORIENTATION=-